MVAGAPSGALARTLARLGEVSPRHECEHRVRLTDPEEGRRVHLTPTHNAYTHEQIPHIGRPVDQQRTFSGGRGLLRDRTQPG